jgi:cytochrome c553
MAFAGTVYASDSSTVPVPNALVRVVGTDGRGYEVTTNCVGNFWAPADDFTLTYPGNGAITTPGAARVMLTHTNRAGSCADCHGTEPGPTTPGRLWVQPPLHGGACTTGFGGGEPFFTGACDETPPTCTTTPSYADVAPIIAARCTACHGPGGQSSNDDFTTEANIVKTGKEGTAASNVLTCKMPPPPLERPTSAERTALYCYFEGLAQANR